MTREEAKEEAKVMLAYAEGKNIQFSCREIEDWKPCEEPIFNFRDYTYRIQPKQTYRPFKDTDECWEEMKKHEPIGWLEHKSGDYKAFINSMNFADVNINNYCYTYEYAFDDFTFIDGTPFGIKEE